MPDPPEHTRITGEDKSQSCSFRHRGPQNRTCQNESSVPPQRSPCNIPSTWEPRPYLHRLHRDSPAATGEGASFLGTSQRGSSSSSAKEQRGRGGGTQRRGLRPAAWHGGSHARIQGLLSSGLQLSRIRGMPSSSLTCREENTELRTRQPGAPGIMGDLFLFSFPTRRYTVCAIINRKYLTTGM